MTLVDDILSQLYAELECVKRAIALLEELQGDDASRVPKPQQDRKRKPASREERLHPIGAAPTRGPSWCDGWMHAQLHVDLHVARQLFDRAAANCQELASFRDTDDVLLQKRLELAAEPPNTP